MFFRRKTKNKRDLSELYEGELEVTIQGVGTKKINVDLDILATHVALVEIIFTGEMVVIEDVIKSPWEICSFNRENGKLVVKRVTN